VRDEPVWSASREGVIKHPSMLDERAEEIDAREERSASEATRDPWSPERPSASDPSDEQRAAALVVRCEAGRDDLHRAPLTSQTTCLALDEMPPNVARKPGERRCEDEDPLGRDARGAR